MIFQPGDLVWIHLRKERLPSRIKLEPRSDGPFQVLERVNDNEYKIDLAGDCQVSTTFTVCDLSPCKPDVDSRMNHAKERGDDRNQNDNDDVSYKGPVTRAQARRLQEDVPVFLNQNEAPSPWGRLNEDFGSST